MAVQERELTDEQKREAEDKKRRRQWLLLLLVTFARLEHDLHAVAVAYVAGDLTAQEFGDDVYSYLPIAFAQAAYVGRRMAGVAGAMDEDDIRFGVHSAEEQEQFLQGFVEDLTKGRYRIASPDGTNQIENLKPIQARLTLYAMGLAATANEAWMESLPDGTLFRWHDSDDSRECSDCFEWARGGPYTRDTLPAVPGDGRSQCKRNCRCELEVISTGERSFDLRALFDGERMIDF